MANIQISVINASAALQDTEVQAVVPALQKQVSHPQGCQYGSRYWVTSGQTWERQGEKVLVDSEGVVVLQSCPPMRKAGGQAPRLPVSKSPWRR